MSNLESFLLIIIILFFFYLGWKIKGFYKNIKFYLYKRKGKKAEKKAIKLLKKNGYKIESFQTTARGSLLQDDETINFFIRADLIVSKNKKKFIAEVKSGKGASIEEINTRRQLLEYSKVFNNKDIILIDTEKNKIKKIVF